MNTSRNLSAVSGITLPQAVIPMTIVNVRRKRVTHQAAMFAWPQVQKQRGVTAF
ncbi:MAG: hypothetical protein AAF658_06325 [Myxococcota bacterium]